MSIYNKILVVADINKDEQPALARAMQLAAQSRSRSKVCFFLSIYDFSYDMTSMLSVDERDAMRRGVIGQREQWMHKVAKPYTEQNQNVDFDVKVVWHNAPMRLSSLKLCWQSRYCNQRNRKHDVLESVIFTPTDWHLLRDALLLFSKNSDCQRMPDTRFCPRGFGKRHTSWP